MHPADDKPKHKPNPKHTLEEILKSLQDLIRNDLLEGDTPAPTAGRPATSATSSTPGGELEALRHSLESLVAEELTPDDAVAIDQPATGLSAPAATPTEGAIPPEGLQDVFSFDTAAQAVAPEEAPTATPPGQDDLQFETIDLATSSDEIEAESSAPPQEQESAAVRPTFDESATADSEALPASDAAPTAEESTEFTAEAGVWPCGVPIEAPAGEPVRAVDLLVPEQPPDTHPPETAGDWEDIPVLDEIVAETAAEHDSGELPDGASLPLPTGRHDDVEPPQTARPRREPRIDSTDEPASQTTRDNLDLPLPAPSRAHDLAVRTVAKLNIELRKAGKRPLDAKVITRLAMMLRETLESDAAKVENKPHE